MNKGGFFKNLMDKGKALIAKAKPAFMKSGGDLADLCDGFVKLPSQTDSAKLRDANPYFRPAASSDSLPSVIIVVVGFHHKKGSIIEYAYPEEAQTMLQKPPCEDFGKKICFVAIPDAVHTLEVSQAHVRIE